MKQKQIVVLGGGFGGISAAKELARLNKDLDITVIDKSDHHTIHGNLYEVASAPEEITDLLELYKSVTVKFSDIFFGTKINFIQAEVQSVNADEQEVVFSDGTMHYDYLIAGLGSKPNFYGIPEAEKYAIPLQNATDALKIRNAVEFAIQTKKLHGKGEHVRFVIAGGGVAGVELAAELQTMLDFTAWKNSFPRTSIDTVVIEGASTLLPGFPDKVSHTVSNRLRDYGIEIQTHQLITTVNANSLELKSGDKFTFDCLVWTAGVQANTLEVNPKLESGRANKIDVDSGFRTAQHNNIFVIGDQCCFMDTEHKPLPGTASQAIYQGEYVAASIADLIAGKPAKPHVCKQFPYAIPLGPKWVIFTNGRYLYTGFAGYVIRELVWLRYYISLLGLFKGTSFFLYTKKIFQRDLPY